MVRLMLLLLGIDYLRTRWRGLFALGCLWMAAGLFVFVDALDGVLYFPLRFFAYLVLIEGVATLIVARTGVGGQRMLRYVKGSVSVATALLILYGHFNANFILSMFFGVLFLADGLMQSASAYVVRYRRWRSRLAVGVAEILIAVFFFQPYPTFYAGTLAYAVGLFLIMAGGKLLALARRIKTLASIPTLGEEIHGTLAPEHTGAQTDAPDSPRVWEGPPDDAEHALTVHVWTPTGSSKAPTLRYPVLDRYIAAVDINGVISTGHAALESPEGVYISLYPAQEIDRSPDQFGRLLRATRDNDVPGRFLPNYATESQDWCPSTIRVRIRNYDAHKLASFWEKYQQDPTYNLTYRNCSSTVSIALEAALEGVVGRLYGKRKGWGALWRLWTTPELWVAAQIRMRALTMAWTPGLTLDYARALSMLADPRPSGWWKMSQIAIRRSASLRRQWRKEDQERPQFLS